MGDDALRPRRHANKRTRAAGPSAGASRIDPWPLKRSRWAVASVRSNSRPPTYGPRSITRTRTVRAPCRRVSLLPHGSDLWATPMRPGRQRAAAAEVVAVEAGAVPRRVRRPVDVQASERPPDAAHEYAGAHALRLPRRSRSTYRPDAAVRSRSIVRQRPRAVDLQRGGDAPRLRLGGADDLTPRGRRARACVSS